MPPKVLLLLHELEPQRVPSEAVHAWAMQNAELMCALASRAPSSGMRHRQLPLRTRQNLHCITGPGARPSYIY